MTQNQQASSGSFPAPKNLADYRAQMQQIPDGSFDREGQTITLSAFRMGRTPVTVAMWKEFAKAERGGVMPLIQASPVWRGDWDSVLDHPIVNVSWDDCKAYADWAKLKFPTEAQWEYAARGGLSKKLYPWGNTYDDEKLWSSAKTMAETKTFRDGTAPVNRTNNVFVNGYGLVDMVGNVWQCCSDWYAEEYNVWAPKNDPQGPSSGKYRVIRGSSWFYDATYEDSYCSTRRKNFSHIAFPGLGLRLCI